MGRAFVEFRGVTQVLRGAGVSDDAIRTVQLEIMRGGGDLLPNSGGLRKIRCAAAGRGKRGGVRIIFADYPRAGICLWVAAFAKNEMETLDRAAQKELSKLKATLDKRLR